MNNHKIKNIAVACSVVLLTSCATMEQTAALATVGCAGAGIAAAVFTGSAGLGAATGVGCEALALGVMALYNYQSKQVRTVQQDQKLYGYLPPVDSTKVKIRNATVSPTKVKAGDTIKLALDYSIMTPAGIDEADVIESMTLKKKVLKKEKGKRKSVETLETLKELDNRSITKPSGGNSASVDFPLPAKMPPGTYVIEHKVTAGTSNDVRSHTFVVHA